MATIAEAPQNDTAHPLSESPNTSSSLKRKGSPGLDANNDNDPVKRSRPDEGEVSLDGDQEHASRSRPNDYEQSAERRKSATQEEKKRGKRLFGGMLNTLSQTDRNSAQQKRRQDIERRQRERMQKQNTEHDHKRTEELSRLRDVRMAEQIHFDEDVLKHKHAQMLNLAQFLKTRAEPRICYLPWKRTPEQDEIIHNQIAKAKDTIRKEREEFERRKSRHVERYGSGSRQGQEPPRLSPAPDMHTNDNREPAKALEESVPGMKHDDRVDHDEHDESGDVMVEAEEDMLIY